MAAKEPPFSDTQDERMPFSAQVDRTPTWSTIQTGEKGPGRTVGRDAPGLPALHGASISAAPLSRLEDLLRDLLRALRPDVQEVDPLGLRRPVEDRLLLRLH